MIDPVARHVALFNEGVRTGDLTPWLNTFTDDAVLTFTVASLGDTSTAAGVALGPASGRGEIEAVYKGHPPASEMSLTAGSPADPGAETVFGEFFWVRAPDSGGRFTLHLDGGRTTRIDIELDAPPPTRPQVPDGAD
ncbi:hypothetical protein GCM10009557_44130 [Virgisporangium ochraceum]|uniref:Uncharacterized protein n=1 Tax=Virgisporangium ochraceum TaxID=65505 RepID=A0A8J3ZTK4_9ACTN|nr:hypothetical protein [Virgisporangium ochraceum]GIJ70234.1 hypothetical protein Voc01_051510 [Virgisporangium ochraceum]